MTRFEFERRYKAMPRVKKAELVQGVVYMPSPVRFSSHAEPHARLIRWLGLYCDETPGVRLADNATVRLDVDNEVQPDVLLRLDATLGGASRVSEDDYIEGPPELVVEIAGSSASTDLHDKLHAYRRNGVREYIVWRPLERIIDWYQLVEGKYEPLPEDAEGVIGSRVFPGLCLALEPILEGDVKMVLDRQRAELGAAPHNAFRKTLHENR